MNEEQFKDNIESRWGNTERRRNRSRIFPGLLLLTLGFIWLLEKARIIDLPDTLFDWPLFLIALGLFIGAKHRFRLGPWLLPIIFGVLILIRNYYPDLQIKVYIWPILVMFIGLLLLLDPKKRFKKRMNMRDENSSNLPEHDSLNETYKEGADSRDYLDVTAVFGGIKKNILSKNFKGGDIVSFMGGSEIDLTQADIKGRIRIDVTNIFGGTKLVVPASWDVQNDITAVFGGVDDKRQVMGVRLDPDKVLILDGTCLFGGLEIRSY